MLKKKHTKEYEKLISALNYEICLRDSIIDTTHKYGFDERIAEKAKNERDALKKILALFQ